MCQPSTLSTQANAKYLKIGRLRAKSYKYQEKENDPPEHAKDIQRTLQHIQLDLALKGRTLLLQLYNPSWTSSVSTK